MWQFHWQKYSWWFVKKVSQGMRGCSMRNISTAQVFVHSRVSSHCLRDCCDFWHPWSFLVALQCMWRSVSHSAKPKPHICFFRLSCSCSRNNFDSNGLQCDCGLKKVLHLQKCQAAGCTCLVSIESISRDHHKDINAMMRLFSEPSRLACLFWWRWNCVNWAFSLLCFSCFSSLPLHDQQLLVLLDV